MCITALSSVTKNVSKLVCKSAVMSSPEELIYLTYHYLRKLSRRSPVIIISNDFVTLTWIRMCLWSHHVHTIIKRHWAASLSRSITRLLWSRFVFLRKYLLLDWILNCLVYIVHVIYC